MKHILPILFLPLLLFSISLRAQIEKVIVEKYYISDAHDAADSTGGKLEAGSAAYRVYIDMKPGCKLKKIYGDANHTLKISSTAIFFNNAADGQSFAKDFSKNRLKENTVALDTWLTLGQTTKYVASGTYFGILKAQDTDGSFIAGANNDGGLLVNKDSSAGIPLLKADGFDTMIVPPSSWGDYGIKNPSTGNDSTIFGSLKPGSEFISNNASLQNVSGIAGVVRDSNQVLVAQLTTKGKISFELNVEILDANGKSINYVAKSTYSPHEDTLVSPYLTYPYIEKCGCKDPDYIEYNGSLVCSAVDSCKTRVVLGCMDPQACNYNAAANYNIPSLCCYPGYCNDRDISVVCPSSNQERNRFSFNLYPDPAQDQITFQGLNNNNNNETRYAVYDFFGRKLLQKNIGVVSGVFSEQVDVSGLNAGVYLFRLFQGDNNSSKLFIKK